MTKDMTLPLGGQKKQWDPPKWMYPIIYNKWKIAIGLLIVVLVFGAFSIGFAAANDANSLGMGLDGMIKTIFEFNDITEWLTVTPDFNLQEFTNPMKYPDPDNPNQVMQTGMTEFVNSLYSIFTAAGTALLAIYWSIGFFDMLIQSNNQIVAEQMIKKFILLIVGMVVVYHAKDIVKGILDVVQTATLRVTVGASTTISTSSDALVDMILEEEKGASWIGRVFIELGYMVRLLIPYAGAIVSNVGIKIFAVARYMEICAIAILSPIMFADFSTATGGFTHSQSFRAIKSVVALALQGLIITIGVLICVKLASVLVSGTLTTANFFDVILGMLAVQLARLGIAAKSQQISRQIVGLA